MMLLLAILALAQAQEAPPESDSAAAREAILAEKRYSLDPHGRLVDGKRRPIRMHELLEVVPDPAVTGTYGAVRRDDMLRWGTTIMVGGVGATVGASLVSGGFLGMLFCLFCDEAEVEGYASAMKTGAALTGVGLVVIGGGIAGSMVSERRREDPRHWYTEPELRGIMDDRNRELRRSLQLPPRYGARLEIRPSVGPDGLGVAGTF